jgi:hypothetical protein
MPFDPTTAQLKSAGGFDPSTAKPEGNAPPFMNEPGLEPVGLFESAIPAVKGYAAALPLIGAATRFGGPTVSRIASTMMPKTGVEMLGGAGAAAVGGVAGELAARQVPEQYAEMRPAARTLGEVLAPASLMGASRLGRGPTPAIPTERIEAARYMGGKVAPEQLALGPQSRGTRGRLEAQQGMANNIYNESLGLPSSNAFGTREFQQARTNLGRDYNQLLTGRKVQFDQSFFDNLNEALQKQQGLAASGITFGQSRAILSALERIGAIPKNFQAKLNSLPRIGEEEVGAAQSQRALSLLNEILPSLRNRGPIEMDALTYNEIRSILGDAAMRTANNRNAALLRQIQGQFDEAANRSMPDIVRDLETVRRRYEALKTLEEAQLQSGSEMGVVPAEAVGKAIRNRMEQNAIYGFNNPLRQIGQAGESLGLQAPATGRTFAGESRRGLSPQGTGYGVLRDLLGMGAYPFRSYAASRRMAPAPAAAQVLPQMAAPSVGREIEDATQTGLQQ